MLSVIQLQGQGQVKVSVANRVVAKVIDLMVFAWLSLSVPIMASWMGPSLAYIGYLGPILGFAYSLLADGMGFWVFRGQSIGKKLFRLQVVSTSTKEPITYRDSAFRNAPVGVATFFGVIPLWGWLIVGLVGVPLMVMEIYLMLSVDSGHRLGDVMGNTEVVEAKR